MAWTIRDAKREKAMIDRIDQGEDRSAAILAASFLEDRLQKAILARLVHDKVVIGEMFKGYGPLATFRAKIDLAFLMSIIAAPMRRHLHRIREIRNRFAHRLDVHDFEAIEIKDITRKLPRLKDVATLHADVKALANKDEGSKPLEIIAVWLTPLLSLPDTERNAYMNTLKIFLFMLEIATHVSLVEHGREGFSLELVASE
jgi:hypothetical protein